MLVRTICKNCVFADYTGDTQRGCVAGMIPKIRRNTEASIIRVEDNEKKFFIIDNHFCMMCRNDEWAKRNVGQNLIEAARNEMRITYQPIISTRGASLEEVAWTTSGIICQTLKPTLLTFIKTDNYGSIRAHELVSLAANSGLQWRITTVEDVSTNEEAIDAAVAGSKCAYYCVINAGYVPPIDLFENLDKLINDKLFRFASLLPDSSNDVLIVPMSIHNHLGGNLGKPLLEKLQEQCPQQIYKTTEKLM